MTSMGKKLMQLGRTGKKKDGAKDKDALDIDQVAYQAYRKSSVGIITPNMSSPAMKHSVTTGSIASLNNAVLEGSIDREDVNDLCANVRSFSEHLYCLKALFSVDKEDEEENEEDHEDIKTEAHRELGELLGILRLVLQKYPSLHTTDVLTAAAVLITKIKSCRYEDLTSCIDVPDLHYSIDQLATAFSCSVAEFLMGDVDYYPTLTKTKSYDDLLSAETDERDSDKTDGSMHSSLAEIPDHDSVLMKSDNGVEDALGYAKAWCKYAKDIAFYIEKRAVIELEYGKNLCKLSTTSRPPLTEETEMPFQSIYCTALAHDIEYSQTLQTSVAMLQAEKFIEPLQNQRLEEEKERKQIQAYWMKEKKKMHDAVINLQKANQLYISRQQEYEKAKENALKVEMESPAQAAKSDKKLKIKEEAMHRAIEAETTYKACIIEANTRHKELERVKADVLSQIRVLIQRCDEIIKNVTFSYFSIQHAVTAPLPVQYQTLRDSCLNYEPCSQYSEFIRHLPVSSNSPSAGEHFSFKPYTPDEKIPLDRKVSSHSSGSTNSEVASFPEESPGRLSADKMKSKLWGHPGTSDSDSISGSSTRSHDSSPSASPGSRHRAITTSSMNDMPEADRDVQMVQHLADKKEFAGHEVGQTTFRGVPLSRAARTHAFHKLRTPSRCRLCEIYVFFHGAECSRCGLTCHKKCLENLRDTCGVQRQQLRRMTTFGVDFIAHVQETHTEIPLLVQKCCAEIEERGLTVKGIYRVSGVKSKVEKLCQNFEIDEGNVDLSEHHPNTISNVLKLYLRQLPEPLLTFTLYPRLMQLAKDSPGEEDEGEIVPKLKVLIQQLPQANLRTCNMLMYHLQRISKMESTNQMSASNLGIVFGPTLLRPSEGAASLDSLMDMPHQNKVVELLIKYCQELFGDEIVGSLRMNASGTRLANEDEENQRKTSLDRTSCKPRSVPETGDLLGELAQEEPQFLKVAKEAAFVSNMEQVPECSNEAPTVDGDQKDSTTQVSGDSGNIKLMVTQPSLAPLSDDNRDNVSSSDEGSEMPVIETKPHNLASGSSPGLKRKLLAKELKGASDDEALSDSPQLSKPRPFSPPLQRRQPVRRHKFSPGFTEGSSNQLMRFESEDSLDSTDDAGDNVDSDLNVVQKNQSDQFTNSVINESISKAGTSEVTADMESNELSSESGLKSGPRLKTETGSAGKKQNQWRNTSDLSILRDVQRSEAPKKQSSLDLHDAKKDSNPRRTAVKLNPDSELFQVFKHRGLIRQSSVETEPTKKPTNAKSLLDRRPSSYSDDELMYV